ncbi:DNA polymerase III, clamp loader complex, gamma/delta/delta subunit [Xylaria flabelliformis]|nr:DNA polymerase III, clamp loader complex, gamma/delta/delta subunit [Xylaria flabelliformis]
MVECPACMKQVQSSKINDHLDSGCETFVVENPPASSPPPSTSAPTQANGSVPASQKRPASSFFQTPSSKRQATANGVIAPIVNGPATASKPNPGVKRSYDEGPGNGSSDHDADGDDDGGAPTKPEDAHPAPRSPVAKKLRTKTSRVAPLAERMRPDNLDEVFGQELVGPNGVLRSLIETNRVPSMILWGASGTGKTTIARCIANQAGSRFIEMNATSSGVAECKKLFSDAANDLTLTGRKTIIFCDEIHRFSKTQQDVFLKPVEAGTITLIGATTENPSFKVVNALLSRCRTFTLQKLTVEDIQRILSRALQSELPSISSTPSSPLDEEFLTYLANFADGDARTALNLLELAISLANRGEVTKEDMKASLTKTLVYDRAGDQHYDTISAFHKAIRGSDPDATLYYLGRMLQSGEDPLFIARRMVVVASEDVGLADNSMLTLATSTFTATQQIGMPEARIPLAHCAVALALAPKSTRAYRGLNNAFAALREPGVAALPIPIHLRNAPTRLMRELGYGKEYKYNPNYKDGKVKQDYLPNDLLGRRFLEERDLGTEVDLDLPMENA